MLGDDSFLQTDRAPSKAPCIDDLRRYDIRNCDPANCQAPINRRCQALIGMTRVEIPCRKCGRPYPESAYPLRGKSGLRMTACDSCREQDRQWQQSSKANRQMVEVA